MEALNCGVKVVDVRIFCGPKFESTGLLDTGVYTKPTFQGSVLTARSSHHPNVHLSWPLARWNHFDRLCSSRQELQKARALFLQSCTKSARITRLCMLFSHPTLGTRREFAKKKTALGSYFRFILAGTGVVFLRFLMT